MIYLCINLYKSVTKVGIYFQLCKKILIFFSKYHHFLPKYCLLGMIFLDFNASNCFMRSLGAPDRTRTCTSHDTRS